MKVSLFTLQQLCRNFVTTFPLLFSLLCRPRVVKTFCNNQLYCRIRMAVPTQYQIIHPPAQNAMGGTHLHTPQSIFQHMMGQQNPQQQNSPWPQMPQVPPMMMPWSIPSLQQSQLVRFTGERPQSPPRNFLHVKRKFEINEPAETWVYFSLLLEPELDDWKNNLLAK